jgi:hypothetical protein
MQKKVAGERGLLEGSQNCRFAMCVQWPPHCKSNCLLCGCGKEQNVGNIAREGVGSKDNAPNGSLHFSVIGVGLCTYTHGE